MTRAIVAGALANKCGNGGEAWVRLSWIRGLQKLGFDVFFIEQIDSHNCVDGAGKSTPFEKSANLEYFRRVTGDFDLAGRAALVCDGGKEVFGLSRQQLMDVADSAALLINISGHLEAPFLMDRICYKAYIDIDPGYTQIWHELGYDGARLAGHDAYFTIGENIGRACCGIPTAGIDWRVVRQPIVLEDWPPVASTDSDRFTTVAGWRGGYGALDYNGTKLGLKAHEFRKVLALPLRSSARFEIALQIDRADAADRLALEQHGWQLVSPRGASATPGDFRRYVQHSSAEFSVAQGIYVATASGWFSDRSARYLASGKPVLLQDTGLAQHYPVGKGLVLFRDLEEAITGSEQIRSNYEEHCRAARQLAEDYFDSDKVVGALLEDVRVTA